MSDRHPHPVPLAWRLLDRIEELVAALWPFRSGLAVGRAFLLPAVLLVGLLLAGLGIMLEHSMHELSLATYRLKPEYSAANYLTFLERPVYIHVLMRTLLAAAIVTIVTITLAFPYAYVLVRTRSRSARKFLLVALFLPFFIGQVVRAYGWLIILGKEGILSTFLGRFGIDPPGMIYNYPAVIFGLIQYMLPFAILLIVPAITAISEEVELASEGLGARWPSTFRHVVLPMASPGIVGASVVVFTLTLTDFAMPEILGGGKNDFIANLIYDSFFQISDPGLGSALSVILVAVGSILVAGVFHLAGPGTLGLRGARP